MSAMSPVPVSTSMGSLQILGWDLRLIIGPVPRVLSTPGPSPKDLSSISTIPVGASVSAVIVQQRIRIVAGVPENRTQLEVFGT
eukprot:ANDGO_01383.mRNA.1 hypothetical protein